MEFTISTEYAIVNPARGGDDLRAGARRGLDGPRSPRRRKRAGARHGTGEQTTLPLSEEEARAVSPPLEVGEEVAGRYRVCGTLGRGATSTVYLVEHKVLGVRYGLKLLNPSYAHNQTCLRDFVSAIKRISALNHPNVVKILDLDVAVDDRPFLVMEYLPGDDLKSQTRYRQPWKTVAGVLRQLCNALEAVHGVDVVHRDIKPSNCRLVPRPGQNDLIKLIDFGVATTREEQGLIRSGTSAGLVVGSPAYMSPEQARGRAVDHRSDIYALGLLTYELLAGHRPLSAPDGDAMLEVQISQRPPPLHRERPGLPARVTDTVMACLEKDPDLRPASVGDLRRALGL